MCLLFLNMGEGEIMVIMLVTVMFFGSKSIPGIAQSLGKGLRELKDATQDIQREIEKSATAVTKGMEDVTSDLPKTKSAEVAAINAPSVTNDKTSNSAEPSSDQPSDQSPNLPIDQSPPKSFFKP